MLKYPHGLHSDLGLQVGSLASVEVAPLDGRDREERTLPGGLDLHPIAGERVPIRRHREPRDDLERRLDPVIGGNHDRVELVARLHFDTSKSARRDEVHLAR